MMSKIPGCFFLKSTTCNSKGVCFWGTMDSLPCCLLLFPWMSFACGEQAIQHWSSEISDLPLWWPYMTFWTRTYRVKLVQCSMPVITYNSMLWFPMSSDLWKYCQRRQYILSNVPSTWNLSWSSSTWAGKWALPPLLCAGIFSAVDWNALAFGIKFCSSISKSSDSSILARLDGLDMPSKNFEVFPPSSGCTDADGDLSSSSAICFSPSPSALPSILVATIGCSLTGKLLTDGTLFALDWKKDVSCFCAFCALGFFRFALLIRK